jgi:hypothetical protein
MLECRRDGPYLVVEAVPRTAVGRLARSVARALVGDAPPPAGTAGVSTREGASGAVGYLFIVAAAGILGATARIAPHAVVAGSVLAIAAGLTARLASVRCARYLSGHRLVLRCAESQATFNTASRIASHVLVAWPRVSGLVGGGDPRSLLDATLWDLARRLSWREAARDSLVVIRQAALRPGTDRDRQVRDAGALLSARDRNIRLTLADLRRLAEACERVPGDGWQADTGTAISELASSTELVVDTYQELLGWSKRFTQSG